MYILFIIEPELARKPCSIGFINTSVRLLSSMRTLAASVTYPLNIELFSTHQHTGGSCAQLGTLLLFHAFPPSRSHLPPLPRSVFVPSPCCPASVVLLLGDFALLPVLLCAFALVPARVGFRAFSLPPFLCSACLLCAPLPVLCLCPVFLLLFVAGCKTPQHRAVEFDVFSFT